MPDATETKTPRLLVVRKEISPQYIRCENCQAWERARRHPQQYTGECRRYSPNGQSESLEGLMTYRAKWPITFRDEGCHEGIAVPLEKGGAV